MTPRSGHRRESENTMQKNIIDSEIRDNELTLVDLDDLRAAFGGEAELSGAPEVAAAPPPKTVMCPSW